MTHNGSRGDRGVRPTEPGRAVALVIALRTRRMTTEPKMATTTAAMKPWMWLKPSCVASQPPMRPPRMPTTMFGRQPRAVEPPTRAPEMAPARKPTTIQPTMFISAQWASSGSSDGRGHVEEVTTAPTKASGWVWWAAWRAPSMTTIRPSRSRASRASVAVAEDRQARPAEDLQDRLADRRRARSSEAAGSSLGLELAQDRAGGGRPRRPDRLRAIRGEVRRATSRRPRS